MTSPRPRSRRLLIAAGLSVAGVVLAGCSATNPITTEHEYSASDGVRATLGDVRASNLLVLSSAKGSEGLLLGGLTNDGTQPRTVTLTFGDQTATVQVAPESTVLLDGTAAEGRADVRVTSVSVPPGAVLPTTIATDTAGSQDVGIPVLDGSQPDYATLVPTPPAS
ncbi:hypothetical protein [Cellulomonas rhizosphaerae]|uniref:DNA modification methylase n=1 Tax=Cellulomonas rhizosphaerae TaxID=2293719 RepID=A0A413RLM0_9CELL|nr:hypothetical protein [Cellulomonas rhizosphaerae]RHA40955.1 hypothetical protein D1825_09450 [Cellulomonas rhizosphaerae]